MDTLPSEGYAKLWELGAVVIILLSLIGALVSGKLVPGYLYKEKVDDNKLLRDQLNKTLDLANSATQLSEETVKKAERQLEDLKFRLAKEK